MWQNYVYHIIKVRLMTTYRGVIDRCPLCGELTPRTAILIEYAVGEEKRQYIECKACKQPVRLRSEIGG